ncbi:SRPBCC family protein [Paenibacillus sp. N3.4]|uniref:SRPBCC family protein n=1 Tax=Paenibacillus sp. N3.4 TaxID=2603222 RepID=UPI0011CB4E32|nr:SRPBCC family protein [Paenibacillus sp. N3.4]TXK83832.1 ATPase [Paenibacillus sp. N3.4]
MSQDDITNEAVAVVNGRELTVTRYINALRSLVYEAWTDPKHLPHWWGPRGFTITIQSMEVRPGGSWVYIMHGPNGVDYPNMITYIEVVSPERLVYVHSGGEDDDAGFDVTVTFEEEDGKTKITMQSTFPSSEALQLVVEKYGAIEGAISTLGRLAEHLEHR